MKPPPCSGSSAILLSLLCAAGLASGFAARRAVSPAPTLGAAEASPAGKPATATTSGERGSGDRSPRRRSRDQVASFPPHRKSADTMETLLALNDDELYTRLAAWLTDATEPDIAAFWREYGPRPNRSNDITDLVFLNWARLDPRAAIAGSSSDHHAWWAWACHDPAGALAEATANAPDHVNHVAWGIGEFHPDWLRAHYHELSNGAKDNALRGMAKWSDAADPLAAMKFMADLGRQVDRGTFKALVRNDPWAAIDWIKDHPAESGGGSLGFSPDESMQLVVDTMAAERPDDLERLAAQTPSGALKVKMEQALFASLLESDPEAALAAAKETKAPVLAVQRFAALGLAAVSSDPDQAFAMAAEMFAASPEALQMMTTVEYPGGASRSGMSTPGVQELAAALIKQDPERTLDMVAEVKGEGHRYFESPVSRLGSLWAESDLVGFTGWVNRQTDPAVRSQGAAIVISKLQQEGHFAESAEWIISQPEAEKNPYGIYSMLQNWQRNDPDAAAAWLEQADLPAERKAEFRENLDRNR